MQKRFPQLRKTAATEPFSPDDEDWNNIVSWIYDHRPMRVKAAPPTVNYRHAWKTTVTWDYEQKTWTAQVHPGYVRAHPVIVETPEVFLESYTFKRLGLGADYKPDPEKTQEARLSELPRFPIPKDRWNNVASGDSVQVEGEDAQVVPAILIEKFNIIAPSIIEVDLSNPGITVNESEKLNQDPETVRQLRSVEIILSVPRPTIAPVLLPDPTLPGIDILSPQVDYPNDVTPRLRLYKTTPLELEQGAESANVLAAIAEAGATESLRAIAKIWMMGPPGDLETEVPDETWTPIVQYQTWFNLDCTTNVDLIDLPPLRIVNPAAALLGGSAAQPFVDSINAENAEAEQLLSEVEIDVGWWTV